MDISSAGILPLPKFNVPLDQSPSPKFSATHPCTSSSTTPFDGSFKSKCDPPRDDSGVQQLVHDGSSWWFLVLINQECREVKVARWKSVPQLSPIPFLCKLDPRPELMERRFPRCLLISSFNKIVQVSHPTLWTLRKEVRLKPLPDDFFPSSKSVIMNIVI